MNEVMELTCPIICIATDVGRDKKTWQWLSKSDIKKETEGMLMAAQD